MKLGGGNMFVIQIPLSKYLKDMLAHCKELLGYQNGHMSIHPRFNYHCLEHCGREWRKFTKQGCNKL